MNALNNILDYSFLKYADKSALSNTEGNSMSYSELGKRVFNLSQKLQVEFKCSQTVIGVLSEKNIHVPVLIYSILKSGNSYMPVDFRTPASRIIHIIKSAKPSAFLVQTKFAQAFCESLSTSDILFEKVVFDSDYWIVTIVGSCRYSSNLAYVLFTSGSTGVPKGIMHTHLSATTFLNWCKGTFNYAEGSKFISIAPFQFDLSVFDLFYPLIGGGNLLLPSEKYLSNSRLMTELIAEKKIEVVYSTPSFFNWLLTTGKAEKHDFTSVVSLQIAGELLKWKLVHALQRQFPRAAMFNLYGPTETNVCTGYHVNVSDEEKYSVSVPIGEPCDWVTSLLIHSSVGTELHISGQGVMAGYIDHSGLLDRDGDLYYNTGDIVVQAFDNNLAYISRSDRMIKKNGFRIEPAEIELCLNKLDGVIQSLVSITREDEQVKLVVFIISQTNYDYLFLKKYCNEQLPYYMVPDIFIFTDEFPLSPHHKVDNSALLRKYHDKSNTSRL